jgi:DNA polymerase I-like protein with 3'-5' exonuclease and polymerase domains
MSTFVAPTQSLPEPTRSEGSPKQAQVPNLPEVNYIVVDIECHGLEAVHDLTRAVYFAVTCTVRANQQPKLITWYNLDDLISVLNSSGYYLVYHNSKFDHVALLNRGLNVPWERVLDTQVLAYLADNQAAGNLSLGALTGAKDNLLPVAQELGFSNLSEFWNVDHSYNPEVIQRLVSYCRADVKATHGLYKQLIQKLPKPSVAAYWKLEQPMLPVLVQLERTGAQVDRQLLLKTIDDLGRQQQEFEARIAECVGRVPVLQWDKALETYVPTEKWYGGNNLHTPLHELKTYANKLNVPPHYVDANGVAVENWSGHKLTDEKRVLGAHCVLVPFNSNAATGHVWWVINKQVPEALENIKQTKSGKPQVNKDFVADVADLLPDEFPIGKLAKVVKRLQMATSIYKYLGNDNRLRPEFAHTRTLTGRLATSRPNAQNLPRAGADESSQVFRKLFVARPGYVLLCADLDQIELRTLAYFLAEAEKDFGLLQEFNSDNPDAHTKNAELWGVSRIIAKILIFLLIYGGQPKLMVERKLFGSLKEAQAAFDGVKSKQPAIDALMRKVVAKATNIGYIKTLAGRYLRYPKLRSSNKWERMRAERQCFNALIQGSSRDIIHQLVVESAPLIWAAGASFVNIVHDEVLVEVPEQTADALMQQLQPLWCKRMDIIKGVPVNGDWNKGSTWYEAK